VTQIHTIQATNGGKIDLRNLAALTPPVQNNDYVELLVSGTNSSIDLSNLGTISGTGGYTRIDVSNGAIQSLPKVQSLNDVQFALSSGAVLTAAGSLSASYSSVDMPFSTTIMSSDGTNTLLDLRALTALSTAFNNPGLDFFGNPVTQIHTIQATNGGKIDLRNLAALTLPVQSEDRIDVIAGTASLSDNSLIDLSALHVLNGNGQVRFTVNGGSTLRLGSIATLKPMSIAVNNAARFEASTNLRLGSSISLVAAPDSTLDMNGRFSFSHTNPANMNLSAGTTSSGAIVAMHGGGQKLLEVGGVDFGTATFLINDGNFGMGQLVVGQTGQPTDVTLFDIANNGHRSNGPETLYLYGHGGQDGLVINPGSKLVLNDLNAYAKIGGTFTNLEDLIPIGQASVAFGGGFIVRHNLPSTLADVNGDGTVTGADIDLERDAIAGSSPHKLWFDVNADNTVSSTDLDYLIHDVLHTRPGDTNLDGAVDIRDLYDLASHFRQAGDVGWGQGDFNADFVVDARDLGDLARNWQYGVASPAMSFAEALASVNLGTSVPEPGELALIGFGLAGVLPRRRRVR
jgi:hypothetical protein